VIHVSELSTRTPCHPWRLQQAPQPMTLQRWWTIVVTVIGLTDGGSSSSSSRLLDSHELLVGTWETNIKFARPRQRGDPTPPTSQLRSMILWSKNPNQKSTSTTARQYALHLFQNFTCVLEPKEEEVNANNDPGPFRHDRPLQPPRGLFGSWKVHPNPYCPTDRYYDTVEFAFSSSSNGTLSSSSSRATTTDAAVVSTDDDMADSELVWVGRCRLTGHYSPGRLFFRARMAFAQGRLSHGILRLRHDEVGRRQEASTLSTGGADGGGTTTALAVVERSNAILLRARFVGRRSIPSEDTLYDLDEAEDRLLFGY
jgi:hypothetical protein